MSAPTVSVIMAIRNEAAHIADTLKSIESQDYPQDKMEIIIADGMSTDRTRKIIDSSALENVNIIDNINVSRAHGLNLAISNSRADIVVRIDARTIIPPDYISRCVNTLLATNADNVGGIQKIIAETPLQKAFNLALLSIFGAGNAQYRIGKKSGFVDTVYLGCYRRSVFLKVGCFDEKASVISEDSDLNYRIRRSGGKIYLNVDIESSYRPRNSIVDIGRIYFRYGGARAGNFIKHRQLLMRQIIPALFVAILVILLIASILMFPVFMGLYFTVGAYMVVNFLISLRLVLKHRKLRLWTRLVLLFPVMHICWGAGFWKKILIPERLGAYWRH